MKKLLLSVIISIVPMAILAQVYHPMLQGNTNTWYYTFNVLPVKQQQPLFNCFYPHWPFDASWEISTEKDTLISGTSYKKVIEYGFLNPLDSCVLGYIREDTATRKVFFLDNQFNPETVIYDFSMNPGDSILINFSAPGYYESGYYFVDSIVNVNIEAGIRKAFYLHNPSQLFPAPLVWIESVGHSGHFTYPVSSNLFGDYFSFICTDWLPRDYGTMLTCFEHSNQKVYFDSCAYAHTLQGGCFVNADSCHYWNICGSIFESDVFAYVEVSPNPSNGNFTVSLDSYHPAEAEFIFRKPDGAVIRREGGYRISQGNNRFSFDLSGLADGIYLIECYTDKGVGVTRLLLTGQ
jgi:hypothetical protein